jgi:hypothetical protein
VLQANLCRNEHMLERWDNLDRSQLGWIVGSVGSAGAIEGSGFSLVSLFGPVRALTFRGSHVNSGGLYESTQESMP